MDKPTEYTPKDILRLLIKQEGVHEGHWILAVNFGFSASNVGQSENGEDACPAGIVALQKVALQQVPEVLPFSLDAAVVNPAPRKVKTKVVK